MKVIDLKKALEMADDNDEVFLSPECPVHGIYVAELSEAHKMIDNIQKRCKGKKGTYYGEFQDEKKYGFKSHFVLNFKQNNDRMHSSCHQMLK